MTTIENKCIQKMIIDLKSIGIIFEFDQEETDIFDYDGKFKGKRKLENVVFQKANRVKKISNYQFFRHGGISCIFDSNKSGKKGEENNVKTIPVTDEMFYDMLKQTIICLDS
jgi:hypothetical protein